MRIKVLDRDKLRDTSRVYLPDGASGLRLRRTYVRYPLIPYICRVEEIHSYYPRDDGRRLARDNEPGQDGVLLDMAGAGRARRRVRPMSLPAPPGRHRPPAPRADAARWYLDSRIGFAPKREIRESLMADMSCPTRGSLARCSLMRG